MSIPGSNGLLITPGGLQGTVQAPPSKSFAHRAIIAAALAHGESTIRDVELSQDMAATVGAVEALGAVVRQNAHGDLIDLFIGGIGGQNRKCGTPPLIDCRESGSTFRFMIPVALVVCGSAVFRGSGRLGQRPIGPYLDIFERQGITAVAAEGGLPLTLTGRLQPDTFAIPGNISSQLFTGLLMAAPLLDGDSNIEVSGGALESLGYIDITIEVLRAFGISVQRQADGRKFTVVGNQRYAARNYEVEGDWSQAAFLLLAGLFGGPLTIGGLQQQSCQGDRAIEGILRTMGADLRWEGSGLHVEPSELHCSVVDVSQCPDLAPAIAAAMAVAAGESRITGGRRLRDKESDRIHSIAGTLNALGADATETEDGLLIRGKPRLTGGRVQSFNDHRIAMMAAAVSPRCDGKIVLQGQDAVNKSWPGFWVTFRAMGGQADEQPMG